MGMGDDATLVDPEERHGRSLKVLGELQEILGVPLLSRVEKLLSKGNSVFVGYKNTSLGGEVVARVEGEDEGVYFSLHNKPLLRELELYLTSEATFLSIASSDSLASRLVVEKENVFFKSDNGGEDKGEYVRKTLQDAKTLRPVLASIGLSDLESAIEALSRLNEGESGVEGSYVLARNERAWMLRRGLVFGEPRLDGDLLLEREVGLSFPGDVEMSFSARWEHPFMSLEFLYIRWGREEMLIDTNRGFFFAETFERNPVAQAIRNGLGMEIRYLDRGEWSSRIVDPSPRMLAFLRALTEHDEPFRALAEGRFLSYAKAGLFLDM
jgi:hypothetical protein